MEPPPREPDERVPPPVHHDDGPAPVVREGEAATRPDPFYDATPQASLPPDARAAWENENYFASAGGAAVPRRPAFAEAPRQPLRFAGILIGIGLFAILFFDANFLHRLILIAPVFEEALKFGVALALVTLLRVTRPGLRAAIALAPGAAFGVLEHYVTYEAEEPALFVGRVAFHAAASMWSMTMWSALEPLQTWRHRWLATAPSTIVHALNNGFAVVTAVALAAIEAGLVPGLAGSAPGIERFALSVHALLVFVLGIGALVVLGAQDATREFVARRVAHAWFRAMPT